MSDRVGIAFRWLDHGKGLEPPRQQTAGAAGLDLPAALAPDEELVLAPGARAMVPTGLSIALPEGYEGQVRPRSGLAARHGITVLNAPGTVDADYRGEVKVILINHGADPFAVRRGDRIAQMVVAAVRAVELNRSGRLDETERGDWRAWLDWALAWRLPPHWRPLRRLAGDRALIDLIGYSEDGRIFAFEEFGIQDGSGFPYSNIYVVDLPADKWAYGIAVPGAARGRQRQLGRSAGRGAPAGAGQARRGAVSPSPPT